MVTEIPLTRGLVALVDDEDAPAVLGMGKWHALKGPHTWYGRRTFGRGDTRYGLLLHRFLTTWGITDHIDGNGLNCQRANLRPATKAQNNHNAALRADNTSGYKGVTQRYESGRWRAWICHEGRRIHLGSYGDPIDAARAYDAAARDLFGEFAWLNFPEPS